MLAATRHAAVLPRSRTGSSPPHGGGGAGGRPAEVRPSGATCVRGRQSTCYQAAAFRPRDGDAADDPSSYRDGGGGGKRFNGHRERSRDHGGSPPVE
ncbi:hypothetical protein CHLRE_16g686202v5 [Chlamydomonas reinhardtii]|uniref:Uncharacterized protein n=1 Tax=Chlamydomonas reinhardtii TaxID=3055 RepID=A0A2K3CUQ2_CHLRE|nr:uncharacterized protein CHLRE_16g686202v5 [Chlamydomonas reinhardtii]PNW72010.1 hypothetical protein CHLRE_16g686202v5 [Chlamydomonas reinhardtii]